MKVYGWALVGTALLGALALLFFLPIPVHSQVPSITLDWTATGDDGDIGTASTYQMRYSSTKPDTSNALAMDNWWANATQASGLPTPLVSGSPQSVTVAVTGGFQTGRTWYFVMKACDEVPNCSGYSNVATKFLQDIFPPSR